jgi:hypothetical protein
MITYKAFLNIALYHDYFNNGLCEVVRINPDEETVNWLKSRGIVFRQTANNFELFAPEDLNILEEVSFNPGLNLDFTGATSDPEFINYTDFPLNELGEMVFSSQPGQPAELNKVFEPKVYPQVVMRISINLDHINQSSEDWPNQYTAHFNARAIRWKYIIIDKTGNIEPHFSLSGTAHSLFSVPHKEMVENIGEAYVFDSGNNLIPFKEQNGIDLSLNYSHSNHSNSLRLPSASPSHLQFDKEGKEPYSTIYLYV